MLSNCACHEGIWGSENFMSYLFYSWGKWPQYSLDMVLGDGFRAAVDILENRNISCSCYK